MKAWRIFSRSDQLSRMSRARRYHFGHSGVKPTAQNLAVTFDSELFTQCGGRVSLGRAGGSQRSCVWLLLIVLRSVALFTAD